MTVNKKENNDLFWLLKCMQIYVKHIQFESGRRNRQADLDMEFNYAYCSFVNFLRQLVNLVFDNAYIEIEGMGLELEDGH